MLNKLRLKLKMLMKGSTRNPQTKFINPYAMSDTTTEQYRVKPEFRDGRFILKDKKEESQMKQDVTEDTESKKDAKDKKEKKEKEPGLSHFIADVVVKDMSAIASISKRKAKAQPIMNPKDQVIQNPPALELELVEPLEPFEPLEPLFEPMDEPQPIVKKEPHIPQGNDIAVANIKRTLDRWKLTNPKVVKK